MWWILITAIDLGIGLVVLKAMALSVPLAKQKRLRMAEKVIWVLLVLSGVLLAARMLDWPR